MSVDNQEQVIEKIKERACVKRDVYDNLISQFEALKEVVKEYADELKENIHDVDERLEISYVEKSPYQINLTIAGDILIFYMHSNVFQFDQTNHVWNTSYVKEDSNNAFAGNILIYNFLADSFRLNRMNDLGYMIARVFVNKEDHFLIEGQKQIGYLYNDYVNNVLDKATWRKVLESALLYTLDFNLFVPPYSAVNVTSVAEVHQLGSKHTMTTGKRFGFQFSNSDADSTGDKVG
jgi:hypothetical protein